MAAGRGGPGGLGYGGGVMIARILVTVVIAVVLAMVIVRLGVMLVSALTGGPR